MKDKCSKLQLVQLVSSCNIGQACKVKTTSIGQKEIKNNIKEEALFAVLISFYPYVIFPRLNTWRKNKTWQDFVWKCNWGSECRQRTNDLGIALKSVWPFHINKNTQSKPLPRVNHSADFMLSTSRKGYVSNTCPEVLNKPFTLKGHFICSGVLLYTDLWSWLYAMQLMKKWIEQNVSWQYLVSECYRN